MKKVMFYCQHTLGIGHLIRSMEIVRFLVKDFQVCFIDGGEVIEGFKIPPEVEVVNLPPIKTDPEFKQLEASGSSQTIDEVLENRKNQLLSTFKQYQPHILIIELFPFGRRKFTPELIPLLEAAKSTKIIVVSSLRDIVITKKDKIAYEERVCQIMNQYFDVLLIHGDPKLIGLEETFSRVSDIKSQVYYTGYVAKPPEVSTENTIVAKKEKPTILVSVGGGRFGHDLLETVVKTAPILKQSIPHHIQVFTGPFIPEEVFAKLQNLAEGQTNITIEKYNYHFLSYMQNAELSISMSGYNTTMNILMTGVKAMMMAFTGNGDREQTIRAEKLEKLGRIKIIRPQDLHPEKLAAQVIDYLDRQPTELHFDCKGAEKTADYLRQLLYKREFAA